MQRDFTYIDDLVEAIARLVGRAPREGEAVGAVDSLSPAAPYRVVNIGGGQPVGLLEFIDAVEASLGVPVRRRFLPMQKGDAPATFASPELLESLVDYKPTTGIRTGVTAFVDWYRGYYSV